MPRFLIEVPHSADPVECLRTIKVFLDTGSHFLTNADWGCADGEHKSWITVEVDSREEARWVVPGPYRQDARIVELCHFSMRDVDELMRRHGDTPRPKQA